MLGGDQLCGRALGKKELLAIDLVVRDCGLSFRAGEPVDDCPCLAFTWGAWQKMMPY
jgi:hypothetical protein